MKKTEEEMRDLVVSLCNASFECGRLSADDLPEPRINEQRCQDELMSAIMSIINRA